MILHLTIQIPDDSDNAEPLFSALWDELERQGKKGWINRAVFEDAKSRRDFWLCAEDHFGGPVSKQDLEQLAEAEAQFEDLSLFAKGVGFLDAADLVAYIEEVRYAAFQSDAEGRPVRLYKGPADLQIRVLPKA